LWSWRSKRVRKGQRWEERHGCRRGRTSKRTGGIRGQQEEEGQEEDGGGGGWQEGQRAKRDSR
jgi:hypothetical protein